MAKWLQQIDKLRPAGNMLCHGSRSPPPDLFDLQSADGIQVDDYICNLIG